MSKTFLLARRLAVVPLALFLAHCQPKSVEDQVAALPELPPETAATLDPETLATKVVSGVRPPETPAPALLGPCCSSTDTRQLKVRFRHTKCGPPGDLIVTHLGGLVLTQGRAEGGEPEMHRLTALRGRKLGRVNLCISSDGPWNAVFTEDRGCFSPTPIRNLTISALGDAIHFVWGGPQNPPANVQVVSCRAESFTRLLCPDAISTCDCPSTFCPAGADCPCPLELPGPST